MREAVEPDDWCYGTDEEMRQRALTYASGYSGNGRFMQQMHGRVHAGVPLTEVMVDRILMSQAAALKGFMPPKHRRAGVTRRQRYVRRTLSHFGEIEAQRETRDLDLSRLPDGEHRYAVLSDSGVSAVVVQKPAAGKSKGWVFIHHYLGNDLDRGGVQMPGSNEVYRGAYPSVIRAILADTDAASQLYQDYFVKNGLDKRIVVR